jgi:hypothetical protein
MLSRTSSRYNNARLFYNKLKSLGDTSDATALVQIESEGMQVINDLDHVSKLVHQAVYHRLIFFPAVV